MGSEASRPELKVNLVFIVNSRTAGLAERDLVSKKEKERKMASEAGLVTRQKERTDL